MKKNNKKPYWTGVTVAVTLLAVAGYYVSTSAAQLLNRNLEETIIRGRVTSTYGPVENARVRIAGESQYTLTDREGRYESVVGLRPGYSNGGNSRQGRLV